MKISARFSRANEIQQAHPFPLVFVMLFAALVVIAARNRFQLTPALTAGDGKRSRRALRRCITLETILGLAVILAAGAVGCLEPEMHLV